MRTWPALDVSEVSDAEPLQLALADFDVLAIHERTDTEWTVYFQTEAERDRALADLRVRCPELTLSGIEVPDEDWAARSQASLRAIRVGRVIVAPPWHVPAAPASNASAPPARQTHVVIIQPSMGFGTGHHATTRLCLEALQQFDLRGHTVIDIGTGSGVLAIAAARLGASRIVAVDDDADAVQAARENVRLNDVAIDVMVADFRNLVLARFDLVLANLTGGLLMAAAGKIQDLAAPRGPVIVSGFTTGEEAAVLAGFPRLRLLERAQEDEWVCLTLQHEAAFE
jgi:ribosomal protein L11 methyltransferase